MSKRRTHSPEFKSKVAMEAISGRRTLQEIAADHAVHPIQVSQWKKQLLEGASELFAKGKKAQGKDESQAKEGELFQQIGKLQMELEWLKKSHSCSDARELRKLVDHDQREITISRQCELLGLPRSTLYYKPIPVPESTLGIMARIDALYWRIQPLEAVGWFSIWPEKGSRSAVTVSETSCGAWVTGHLPEATHHGAR